MKMLSATDTLICSLCKNYFVDVITTTECIHSFCRRCFFKHIEKNMSCPKCPNKPFTNIQEAFRRDKSIQSIVYLVSPETYWEQLESKGEFLAKKLLSEEEQELIIEKDLVQFADQLVDENDKISITLEYLSDLANIQTSLIHSLKNEKIGNITINIPEGKLKKEDSSKAFKRYFLVKAKTKISSLVELMELKFDLKKTEYEIVFTLITHPFVLNPELTIKDVIYMSYFDRQNPLHMYFTILRKPREDSVEIVELDKEDEAAAPKDMPRLEKMDTIPLADEPPKLEKVNQSIPDVTANFSTQLINGQQNAKQQQQGNNILPNQNGKQNHGVKRKSTLISSPPVSPPALIKESIDGSPNKNQKFNINSGNIMPTLQLNGIPPTTGTQQQQQQPQPQPQSSQPQLPLQPQPPTNILPNNKIPLPTNFTMPNGVTAFNQFVSQGPGGQQRNSLPPNYVYAITNGIPNQVFNTPFIQTQYNMMNCNKLPQTTKYNQHQQPQQSQQPHGTLSISNNEPKPKKGRRSAETISNNIMSQQLAQHQQQLISSIFNGQGNNRPVFLQNDAGQIIGSNGNNIMILHQSSNLLSATGIHPQPQQIKVLPTLAPKINNNQTVGKVTKA